jgi:lysozyme
MSEYTLGVDLSHYRKNCPLKQVKIQGGRFVIGKCTEGLSYVDETYESYKLESKNKYLPFGGYMYWRVGYDALKQAKHFVNTLGETELPPIVDVERFNNVVYGTNRPLYSVGAMVGHLKIVLDEVEWLTKRKPMLYTNYNSWSVLTGNHPLIADYPLWVANYGRSTPLLPIGAKNWVLWQFTSVYKVTGYYRGIDANWFNGNESIFESWLVSMKPKPPPPPPPPPPDEMEAIYLELGGTKYMGEVKVV